MDERIDLADLPELGQVKPRMLGSGLALPPIAPIAGVAGILLGLIVGLSLGPKTPAPQPTTSPVPLVTVPTESASATEFEYAYVLPELVSYLPADPPANGLSLEEALRLLYAYDPAITPGQVTAASVELQASFDFGDGSAVTLQTEEPRWVWAFTVEPDLVCSPGVVDGTVTDVCTRPVTYRIEFDYMTGEYIGLTTLGPSS